MGSERIISPKEIKIYRDTTRRRSQARFQSREKLRQQAKQGACTALEQVLRHYPAVRRVYLFGSILSPGTFNSNSDIDVAVEGANMGLCLDIWRDLEGLQPDWQFDVRSLDKDKLFAERIRQKGELVYGEPA